MDVCGYTTQAYIFLSKKSKKLLHSEKLPLHIASAKATEHKHQPKLSHKYRASCRFLPSDSLDFFIIKSFAARGESRPIDLVSKKPHLILYRYVHLKWNRWVWLSRNYHLKSKTKSKKKSLIFLPEIVVNQCSKFGFSVKICILLQK